MAESIVRQKSYDFALQIIKLCIKLRQEKHFEIASQLVRSGTSIGANVEEALAGRSRKDFFAKMCIASKEARETNYRLGLLTDSKIIDKSKSKTLIAESEELTKILTSIVKTTQNSKLRTQN